MSPMSRGATVPRRSLCSSLIEDKSSRCFSIIDIHSPVPEGHSVRFSLFLASNTSINGRKPSIRDPISRCVSRPALMVYRASKLTPNLQLHYTNKQAIGPAAHDWALDRGKFYHHKRWSCSNRRYVSCTSGD